MYGCEAWTMTANLTKAVSTLECWESYIRWAVEIPHHRPGVIWEPSKAVNENPSEADEVCVPLLPKFRTSQLVLWHPTHGRKKRGRLFVC